MTNQWYSFPIKLLDNEDTKLKIKATGHFVKRLSERKITRKEVREVVDHFFSVDRSIGQFQRKSPEGDDFYKLTKIVGERPLVVVIKIPLAKSSEANTVYLITTYQED